MIFTPDTLFHGRYCVVRCLKAGGMGAVYEVVDKATHSHRALKVLLPDSLKSADLRLRFEREATITGAIESDHVVRTTDAGLDEATGMPFLVMELLRGEELANVVARCGHLSPDEVLLYLRQAALGLDKVHAAGIVHRDLKPENLFVVLRDDGSPCLKIIDFGVAKVVATVGELKKTRVIGTPLFMAPEQTRGDGHLGPGVDLYALGHIAYMLLTGEPYWIEEAYAAESVQAFVRRIVEGPGEPPSARALRRAGVVLPPAFDGWFARATAAMPEQRFGHATGAVAALAEALEIPAGTSTRASREPSAPSGSADAYAAPAREPPQGSSAPVDSPPSPAPLTRTTSALAHEPPVRPPAPAWLRFALPAAAAALLVLGVAVVAMRLRSSTSDDAAGAERDFAPAASVPVALDAASRPASLPTPTTSLVPGDVAPAVSGDAAPASPPAALPSASSSASAVSKPQTRPAPRPRPSNKLPASQHPGID